MPRQRINHDLGHIALKSGFKFRDIENRALDWRALGCVDVNKVIDNQDYDFLQRIIPKIIEAPMQSILNTAVLDPAVSTLFRLSQLGLQYLSFCQQFMDHTLYDLRTAYYHLQKKNVTLKQNFVNLEESHYKAKERIVHLESLMGQQKSHEVVKTPNKKSIPCKFCTKNFLSDELLKAHLSRKHGEKDTKDQRIVVANQNTEEKKEDTGKPVIGNNEANRTDDNSRTEENTHKVTKKNDTKEDMESNEKGEKPLQTPAERNDNSPVSSTSPSASSSTTTSPRPNVINESEIANYILVDRDHQARLQMELKELKEKMNAAEREFFQMTLVHNNNNNDDSMGALGSCEVCAKRKRTDLTNVAIQCGGNEKDVDTQSMERRGDAESQETDGHIPETSLQEDLIQQHASAEDKTTSHSTDVIESNDPIDDDTIEKLKREIANLKMELVKKSQDELITLTEKARVAPDTTQQTDTVLEQTSVKIDVIQQKFLQFENMYFQSQQEFIANFRNLDERQKMYMSDIELTIKDIIGKSLSAASRSNLTIDVVGDTNLSDLKQDNVPEVHDENENQAEVEREKIAKDQEDDGDRANTSSEYSLTDYSVEHENDDEIIYPIQTSDEQEQKEMIPVPQKRKLRINRSVAVEELGRRLTEVGVNPSAIGLSTRKTKQIAKELSEDRDIVKKIYKSYPNIRHNLEKEIDRIAKAKLSSTGSFTSLSSVEDAHFSRTQVTRKRPKSAKHRTVHEGILKKLITNDIDESNLKGKMLMAQSALNAHRECIQELLKTTAHAPTPLKLSTRGHSGSTSDQKKIDTRHEDEIDDIGKRVSVDEFGASTSNRYNKMPNVTTRKVVFIDLNEDS